MTTNQQYFNTRPKLLAILQMGGARGQLFTAEQVVYFLGKYIEKQQLYDPSNKRNICCESDLLGEVLQVKSFTVTDFKNLWKLVFPCLVPATKKEISTTKLVQEQGESSTNELPWWHFVSRTRRQTDDETDAGSYAGKETIGVQDSEYESDREDTLEYEPVYSESEAESDATEPISSEDEDPNMFNLVPFQSDTDEETTTTDFSMDSDIMLDTALKCVRDRCHLFCKEEHWTCHECSTPNRPTFGYCQRCWVHRRGWVNVNDTLPPTDPLRRSLTDPVSARCNDPSDPDKLDRSRSLDVPDGVRRSADSAESMLVGPSHITPILPFAQDTHKTEAVTPGEPQAKKTHLDTDSDVSRLDSASSGVSTNSSADSSCPGLCNICRNNPNNATIVHGNSGHQFCCYRCAKRLRRRGKACPVCRQPIVLIIKNFIVQF